MLFKLPDYSQQLKPLYFVDSVLLGEDVQRHQLALQTHTRSYMIGPSILKEHRREKIKTIVNMCLYWTKSNLS